MKFTAAEIANLLDGKVEGDDSVEVTSLSKKIGRASCRERV